MAASLHACCHRISWWLGTALALTTAPAVGARESEPASPEAPILDAAPARDDPLASAQRARHESERAEEESAARNDREFTILPVVGGTTDIGFGGGYIASFAQMSGKLKPYRWRLESAGTFTLKPAEAGDDADASAGLQVPYVDDYLLLVLPHVVPDKLRFEFRASFTRERALKFYGLGNAARPPPGADLDDSRFEYSRTHPTVDFKGEARLGKFARLYFGATYTHNWLRVTEGSLLAERMRNGSAEERKLLGDADRHGTATFSYGVGWDQRDEETSTHRGHYHGARVDLSPGAGEGSLRFRYGRVNVTSRAYVPLLNKGRLTFAARFVGDFLFGNAPFYELAMFDRTYAIGGAKGVRGVPAQRYYGKLKLFTNFELRSELFEFRAFGKENILGVTGFFDSGRVFTDLTSEPALDGHSLGLKYGAGGGPRFQAGDSFVLRLDVAWSPDANPVGGYLSAGQLF